MFRQTHRPHAATRRYAYSGNAALCGVVALLLSACGRGGAGGGGPSIGIFVGRGLSPVLTSNNVTTGVPGRKYVDEQAMDSVRSCY